MRLDEQVYVHTERDENHVFEICPSKLTVGTLCHAGLLLSTGLCSSYIVGIVHVRVLLQFGQDGRSNGIESLVKLSSRVELFTCCGKSRCMPNMRL